MKINKKKKKRKKTAGSKQACMRQETELSRDYDINLENSVRDEVT